MVFRLVVFHRVCFLRCFYIILSSDCIVCFIIDDRVLIVIGGDDNYKDQSERDKSVLSRWAWHKICSQFTEEYLNGEKSFIFSWDESHHPIHEEALEFYLDPKKTGSLFVPRPKPKPTKVEPTIKAEQPKYDPLQPKKEEPQAIGNQAMAAKPLDQKGTLGKEFPPAMNKNRPLPPLSTTISSTEAKTDPLQKVNPMMKSKPSNQGTY
jgi:hypothetical protein